MDKSGASQDPPLRLGLVHCLRGVPEVHVVEALPGDSLGSVLERLNYPPEQLVVTDLFAPTSLWKSSPAFQPQQPARARRPHGTRSDLLNAARFPA